MLFENEPAKNATKKSIVLSVGVGIKGLGRWIRIQFFIRILQE